MTAIQPHQAPKIGRQHTLIAFTQWIAAHDRYKPIWGGISKEAKAIVHGALTGVRSLTPLAWNAWWTTNHMRYIAVRGKEQRLIYEMLTVWLGEIASGRAKTEPTKKQ